MRATPSQKNRLRRRKLALAATYWAPHIGSMNEEYDYVIVGAGSAGCVLADRLTEDGRHTVALLEYGGSDRSIFIQMPAALSIPMNMKAFNWGYVSEPEPNLNGRRIALSARARFSAARPRSMASSMCAAIHSISSVGRRKAPRAGDIATCCPTSAAPKALRGGADAWRGDGGPLATAQGAKCNPLYEAFIEAGRRGRLCGQPRPQRRAAGGIWPARHDGEGRGARVNRQRLSEAGDETTQSQGGHARARDSHRLRWAPRVGVRIPARRTRPQGERAARGDPVRRADQFAAIAQALRRRAGGGAREFGIEVVADRPGVGENLQDHLEFTVQVASKQPITSFPIPGLFGAA